MGKTWGVPAVALVLVTVTACGAVGSGGGPECTAIGASTGIGVDLAPEVAAAITGGQMEVCWNGDCHTKELTLSPSTKAGPTTCTNADVCSAQAVPTGGKHGFADLPGLPAAEVKVTVGFDGGPTRTVHLIPKMLFPNGPDCGGQGPQGQLELVADGSVRVK
ncbi:hypothetical protein AB5J62_00870 [Amycolatopsis sp. cg5]|uniref:hypothetical protein n=1 Tax=Amycolatopsis sp. cg5 TaxID=3238802 RepID=UPI003525498D